MERIDKRCIEAVTLPPGTPLRQAVKAFSEAYIQANKTETVVVTLFGWKESDGKENDNSNNGDRHQEADAEEGSHAHSR